MRDGSVTRRFSDKLPRALFSELGRRAPAAATLEVVYFDPPLAIGEAGLPPRTKHDARAAPHEPRNAA